MLYYSKNMILKYGTKSIEHAKLYPLCVNYNLPKC